MGIAPHSAFGPQASASHGLRDGDSAKVRVRVGVGEGGGEGG